MIYSHSAQTAQRRRGQSTFVPRLHLFTNNYFYKNSQQAEGATEASNGSRCPRAGYANKWRKNFSHRWNINACGQFLLFLNATEKQICWHIDLNQISADPKKKISEIALGQTVPDCHMPFAHK